MKLTESLSANVDPILRDYIHAAIDEALQPLRDRLRIEKVSYEGMLAQVIAHQGGTAEALMALDKRAGDAEKRTARAGERGG